MESASDEVVLIDNDPLVRMTWKMVANRRAAVFRPFESVEEFIRVSGTFDKKRVVIYIDSDLGTQRRGEDAAKEIRALGFERIFLTTGSPPSHFARMTWLSGVVGKDPPWT